MAIQLKYWLHYRNRIQYNTGPLDEHFKLGSTDLLIFFQIDMTKDALFRGEFEVVKELMAAFPDGDASKRECDKVTWPSLVPLMPRTGCLYYHNRDLNKKQSM